MEVECSVSHTAALTVMKGLCALGVRVGLDIFGENSVALSGIEIRSIATVLRQFTILTALISVKIT